MFMNNQVSGTGSYEPLVILYFLPLFFLEIYPMVLFVKINKHVLIFF